LSLGELRIELAFERFAALFGFGVELVADLGAYCLRAVARIRERLLIGGKRRLRFGLGALRLGKIRFDALGALLDDTADTRDRDARDQQIERDESDHQPDD